MIKVKCVFVEEWLESDIPLSNSCSSEGRAVEEPVKELSTFGEQFLEAILEKKVASLSSPGQ